jgi:hypothetical protein
MKVKIIINEHQSILLLREQISQTVQKITLDNHERIVNMLDKSSGFLGEYKEELEEIIGDYCGVAGLLLDYTKNEFPDIKSSLRNLIVIGAICKYFYPNKDLENKIKDKLSDSNLDDLYNKTLSKANKLSKVFTKFINGTDFKPKTKKVFQKYSFIIPLIPTIKELVSNGKTQELIGLINNLTDTHFLNAEDSEIKELVARIGNIFE